MTDKEKLEAAVMALGELVHKKDTEIYMLKYQIESLEMQIETLKKGTEINE